MRCDNNLEKLVTITAEDQAHLHNFEQRKKSWIVGVKGKKRKWQKTAFPKFLFFSNNHVPRIITYWFSAKTKSFQFFVILAIHQYMFGIGELEFASS